MERRSREGSGDGVTAPTFRITRWRKTPTGEEWTHVRGGFTKERAEELVDLAKWDPRTALRRMRVEEEN